MAMHCPKKSTDISGGRKPREDQWIDEWAVYRSLKVTLDKTPPETGRPNNPLDMLGDCHRAQFRFCDFLEKTADNLPSIPPLQQISSAISLLRHDLPLHHLDESQGLFPLILKHAEKDDEIEASIDRLTHEHDEDEGFAGEIIDLLEILLEEDIQPGAVGAAGYMLRGFFETTRRHIAFEDEVILPFARRTLSPVELTELTNVMASNRNTTPQSLFTFGACGLDAGAKRPGSGKLFDH